MNGHTQVTMHPDGTAYVMTGNHAELFSVEQVEKAKRVARVCVESRRARWPIGTANCSCLACEVAKAAMRGERQ